MMLSLAVVAILIGAVLYFRMTGEKGPPPELTEERIKQQWRELGFFSEVDNEKRIWTLTASRAGLLYFPDLLLGYVADPAHASDGASQRYGPYGSLEIKTWPDPGFSGNAIRGSLVALTHLAELIEVKLATAEQGSPIRIRAEFAPESPYTLVLDVRPDGFDPASADRERLGPTTNVPAKEKS